MSLYEIFKVDRWGGWAKKALYNRPPRNLIHEYLSQGGVVLDDSSLVPAAIEDLIRDGLYAIMPEFDVPRDHEHAGLYVAQVLLRIAGFAALQVQTKKYPTLYSYDLCPRFVPMTAELLERSGE